MTTIQDMPKLQSPFVRERNDAGDYCVTPEIVVGYEWVFDDPRVRAVEKLHGTNVSVCVQDGMIMGVWNRKTRIPFFNRGKDEIIDGVREAYKRKYIDMLPDGQHFGELIGEKYHKNPYKIERHLWVPFVRLQNQYAYKSWGRYPKTFDAISEWFRDLMPLYGRKTDSDFVEGVVFTHPDGRMAKLRRDMFDWYEGRRH